MRVCRCIFDSVIIASLVVGIALLALSLPLLIVGFFTLQIINPSYVVILAVSFVSWILAFSVAAVTLLLRNLRESRRLPEGCCRRCGYDITMISSRCCPECGLSKYDSA